MTLTVEQCIQLTNAHMDKRREYIEEAKKELEQHETRVRELTEFIMKENYHFDKFSKVAATMQMDHRNEKPFYEIHPRLVKADE